MAGLVEMDCEVELEHPLAFFATTLFRQSWILLCKNIRLRVYDNYEFGCHTFRLSLFLENKNVKINRHKVFGKVRDNTKIRLFNLFLCLMPS